MNPDNQFCVRLIHCGNKNISNPNDNLEKFVFYMPMGIFSLASILDKNGFDAEIIHLDLESGKRIGEILDFDTVDAVGFVCHWANQGRVVMDIAALVKKYNPGIYIFLGGHTASFFATEILEEYPAVDAVIRGDGEIPIVELCKNLHQHLLKSGDAATNFASLLPGRVQNLTWRGTDNKVTENELSYVSTVQDLDQFDFTAIHLLKNWETYLNISKYWTKFKPINTYPMFLVEVGRGCKYNCSYCGGNAHAQACLSNRNGQVRRSIDSIIGSIKKGISYGYKCFFVCFEFDRSDEWYTRLFRRIGEEKLDISFAYESWSIPSKALVDVMSETFERVIYTISPDNGVESVRKRNKDKRLFYSNGELETCLDHIAAKPNVNVQLYFGYFTPFETEEDVYKTMSFITKLFVKYSNFTEIVYMNFNTDPCSSLFLNPEKYDFHLSVHHFRDFVRKLKINFEMRNGKVPGMTLLSRPRRMTAIKAVNLANKINLFNNLFYFRDSVLNLFSKVSKTTLFSDYFRTIDLSFASKNDFTLDKVRQVFHGICREQDMSREMFNIIEREYERIGSQSLIDNLTHFYTLDNEEEKKNFSFMQNKLVDDGDFEF
jgi:radical SAM superfamily enzyme YgiQ (UPF0313 family)